MSVREEFIEYCKNEILELRSQLEHYEKGKMRFSSQTAGEPQTEITDEVKSKALESIAQYEKIISAAEKHNQPT